MPWTSFMKSSFNMVKGCLLGFMLGVIESELVIKVGRARCCNRVGKGANLTHNL